jgi:transaldolase
MNVKLFADGADKDGILEMYKNPQIDGFTTNPTLMRKAGITNYVTFAKDILREIPDKPLSFEVFADEFGEMEKQAIKIAGWGQNVYVKIPVMNTKRETSYDLVRKLSQSGVQLNITAMMTLAQVRNVSDAVQGGAPCFVSVFAGRIADTGIDPIPLMEEALVLLEKSPNAELLWASPREVLNVYQAEAIGCHIITATNDILKKLNLEGKDLTNFSQETVQMFFNDAQAAGFQL